MNTRGVIRALLFDAAGTLIEPAEPVAEVYARAAADLGHPLDPVEIQHRFREAFTGLGDPEYDRYSDGDSAERDWWSSVVHLVFSKILGEPLPEGFFQPCFASLFAHYASPAAWRVFPEVPAVLKAATDAGFRVAVVSNFDRRLHEILGGHGLRFEQVITSADARARKPDPSIFLQTLDQLGLSSDEVLHVGDSRHADVEGARAAGIEAFLLDRPAQGLGDFLIHAFAKRGK